MAKDRKKKKADKIPTNTAASREQRQEEEAPPSSQYKNKDDDDESEESSSSEEDMALDGMLIRKTHPDQHSSSSDDEDDTDGDNDAKKTSTISHDNGNNLKRNKPGAATGLASISQKKKKQKRSKKKNNNEPDMLQVEFTFCDIAEKYFHGLKNLLQTDVCCRPHSSELADLMIAHPKSVGTVVSTSEQDDDCFGFASVLPVHVATNASSTSPPSAALMEYLRQLVITNCPPNNESRKEVQDIMNMSNKSAGFLFHGRMINLPLEIVLVLHQQLILDLDYAAAATATETTKQQQPIDFDWLIRIAPFSDGDYKFFDDEILATHAQYQYPIADNGNKNRILILTKAGHRAAIKSMEKMIG